MICMRILKSPPWPISGKGDGVSIALLDSGLSRIQPALSEVIVVEARSFTNSDPFLDTVGHGTDCCSILVASPGHNIPTGVVQNVRLFVGQIIESCGTGSVRSLCEALEWISTLAVDVLAIPSGRISDSSDLRRSLDLVLENGTVIMSPVGNPYNGQRKPLYPAAYPEVVGVGSEAYLESYRMWNSLPDVTMLTHGVSVCTSNGECPVVLDTSKATMLVAGFSCLLVEQRRKTDQPRMTRDSFLSSLQSIIPL